MMSGFFKSIVRISSFIGKELRELIRRPGAIASLIFGPFLIMAIFGIGYRGYRDPFVTEVVTPADSNLPSDPGYYENLTEGRLNIVRVGHDEQAAIDRLRKRQVDFVVAAPPDAAQQLRAGKQSVLHVSWNEVDPVADGLAQVAVNTIVHELNAEIIRQAADQGFKAAAAEGADVQQIPPEVIAEPTKAETQNLAPTKPDVLDFFGPAVFALVLQHLAVTLTALSMVRERLGGQMDRFRVSPLNSMELLIGKYVAYALFSLVISAIVAALLVLLLGVPMLGGVLPFAGIVLLLTFASLGVGLLISLIADSERQAVQLSMLVLLASVFFSGFVLPVEEFIQPVRYLAYILPVTHGIDTLQESMLRGGIGDLWMLGALALIGLVLYVGSLLRLRRVLRSAI
jgi:ABC-2 type transport system permease protein